MTITPNTTRGPVETARDALLAIANTETGPDTAAGNGELRAGIALANAANTRMPGLDGLMFVRAAQTDAATLDATIARLRIAAMPL